MQKQQMQGAATTSRAERKYPRKEHTWPSDFMGVLQGGKLMGYVEFMREQLQTGEHSKDLEARLDEQLLILMNKIFQLLCIVSSKNKAFLRIAKFTWLILSVV